MPVVKSCPAKHLLNGGVYRELPSGVRATEESGDAFPGRGQAAEAIHGNGPSGQNPYLLPSWALPGEGYCLQPAREASGIAAAL